MDWNTKDENQMWDGQRVMMGISNSASASAMFGTCVLPQSVVKRSSKIGVSNPCSLALDLVPFPLIQGLSLPGPGTLNTHPKLKLVVRSFL
jgi:hypothetical protein